jgi:DNA replication licensing factor MCM6
MGTPRADDYGDADGFADDQLPRSSRIPDAASFIEK